MPGASSLKCWYSASGVPTRRRRRDAVAVHAHRLDSTALGDRAAQAAGDLVVLDVRMRLVSRAALASNSTSIGLMV